MSNLVQVYTVILQLRLAMHISAINFLSLPGVSLYLYSFELPCLLFGRSTIFSFNDSLCC